MSIRKNYEEYGVENYYKEHAEYYKNHHYDQLKNLLIKNKDKIKNNKILDLCCGHGEVTSILLDLGFNNITGCDPYTSKYYKIKTNKNCYNYNFIDIINYKLEENFDCVICSFGMHLCLEKNLKILITSLKYLNIKDFIIITPHKRPNLDRFFDNKYIDYSLTNKNKKVFLKIYS